MSVKTGEAGPVGFIDDYPVPIVGRVSMDFITVDVTGVPPELARRGGWVEVMGQRVTVDDLTGIGPAPSATSCSPDGARCTASTKALGASAMARTAKSVFVCQNCGAVAPRWAGKCAACGEWNTLVEEADAAPPPGSGLARASKGRVVELQSLASGTEKVARLPVD